MSKEYDFESGWKIFWIRIHFERGNRQYREKNVTNTETWRNLSKPEVSQWHWETGLHSRNIFEKKIEKLWEKERYHTMKKQKIKYVISSISFYYSKISLPHFTSYSDKNTLTLCVSRHFAILRIIYSRTLFLTFNTLTVFIKISLFISFILREA